MNLRTLLIILSAVFACVMLRDAARWLLKEEPPRNETPASEAPAAPSKAEPSERSPRYHKARDLNKKAVEFLGAGRHAEAIHAFLRARELDPEDPILRRNLAAAYYQEGVRHLHRSRRADRFIAAELSFRSGANVDPQAGNFAFMIGYSAYLGKDLDKAAAQLEEVVRRFPDEWRAYEILGKIRYERGDIPGAVEILQRGLAGNPKNASLRALLAKAGKENGFEMGASIFFDFHYDGKRKIGLRAKTAVLARMLDNAYANVGRELGFFPKDRIQVILYDTDEFSASVRSDSWAGGVFDGKIRIPVGDFESEKARLRRVIRHEYTHAVVFRVAPQCPTWLNEGLAQLLEGVDAKGVERRLKAQRGSLLPPGRLKKSFHGLDARQARLAYDMSYSMTKSLRDRHGSNRLAQFLKESGRRPDAMESEFQRFFQKKYEDFIAGWRAEHQ